MQNVPNLDEYIGDEQVQQDLANILWTIHTVEHFIGPPPPPGMVEIDEGWITVPKDSPLEVLSKSWRQNNYEGCFGNTFAVLVAIGGVVEFTGGIPRPKYCYATLFYSEEKQFITLDFHSRMR